MKMKVLCVDDDANILAGYARQLRKQFALDTAVGGKEGLEAIEKQGPYAVVISDMRMPEMNGIQFLEEVSKRSPETIRMMLTGNADLKTAIDAVNQGNVFRFLTKPCPPENMAKAISDGIELYQLKQSEKILLRDTLTGSVKTLTDIVSLVNPIAFGRASRIRRYVRHIAGHLELPDIWEFELAAMLSQIGCVAVPAEILDKVYEQEMLTREEQQVYNSHPELARKLLNNIPKMDTVAEIVRRQQEPFWVYNAGKTGEPPTRADLGTQILKVALDLDGMLMRSVTFENAWRKLRSKSGEYNPDAVDALMDLRPEKEAEEIRDVALSDLQTGMVVDDNIASADGSMLVPKGTEINYPILVLLRNAATHKGVAEPIRVRISGWVEDTETPDAAPAQDTIA